MFPPAPIPTNPLRNWNFDAREVRQTGYSTNRKFSWLLNLTNRNLTNFHSTKILPDKHHHWFYKFVHCKFQDLPLSLGNKYNFLKMLTHIQLQLKLFLKKLAFIFLAQPLGQKAFEIFCHREILILLWKNKVNLQVQQTPKPFAQVPELWPPFLRHSELENGKMIMSFS